MGWWGFAKREQLLPAERHRLEGPQALESKPQLLLRGEAVQEAIDGQVRAQEAAHHLHSLAGLLPHDHGADNENDLLRDLQRVLALNRNDLLRDLQPVLALNCGMGEGPRRPRVAKNRPLQSFPDIRRRIFFNARPPEVPTLSPRPSFSS